MTTQTQNPAQLSTSSSTTNVERSTEVTSVLIEYTSSGITLTTVAAENVTIDGKTFPGKSTRYRSSAPTLAEAAARAEQMFAGESDAADFAAPEVEAMLTKFGRYVARFHAVMEALSQAQAVA